MKRVIVDGVTAKHFTYKKIASQQKWLKVWFWRKMWHTYQKYKWIFLVCKPSLTTSVLFTMWGYVVSECTPNWTHTNIPNHSLSLCEAWITQCTCKRPCLTKMQKQKWNRIHTTFPCHSYLQGEDIDFRMYPVKIK